MRTLVRMAVALAVAGTAALAHGGVKDVHVMARMQGMSTLAAEMKVIGRMAKGEAAFNPDAIDSALARMADEAARIPALFTPEASDPKSEARPAIWQDFGTFTTRADALQAVSLASVGTVESPVDLGKTMQKLGGACKACHATFKQ
ncbi:c-type cytochrome [Puniceibacterium confluentis]|uniref:c-type cytochrome n=1 Tax=Puniceibacterium confluentis TaxID=1958944 RepID=UPI0035676CB4